MSYYTYMKKAADEVLVQAENGLWYLEPSFRVILDSAELEPDKVKDYEITYAAIKEYMELEVTKRNTIADKKPAVIDWLYETMTSVVEPAMLEEETELFKNMTEYMKAKQDQAEEEKNG